MEHMAFDACIDLVGAAPRSATEPVRRAIEALPGAAWISVAWLGEAMGYRGDLADVPADRWIRVWRRGSSREVDGPAWHGLRRSIRRTVLDVLAADETPEK